MLYSWKKAYAAAMRETDPAKCADLSEKAGEAIYQQTLELARQIEELREARRQLTLREHANKRADREATSTAIPITSTS